MPQPPSQPIATFLRQVAETAQSIGIKNIVLAVRDPITREPIVIASAGSYDDLRAALELKLGSHDMTEWGG